MDQRPSKLGLFLAELKRRHVWRAAIAYAAASFVILQAGEIVLPAFSAPEWALRLLVVVTLLAFPVTLVLAWIYEITPQGIRKTKELEADPQRRGQSGSLFPRLAFLGVTLITVAAIGWWMMSSSIESAGPGGGGEAAPMSSAAFPVSSDPNAPIRSLAVLPFSDFSEGAEQDYFSAGMHEAVIWQLSQLASVRVVSRTSVMPYASGEKTTPQIARELGVQGIVEGSVLRSGDRVQITVQLIHGPSDTHLWSQRYERDLTDVISLQNEVAQAIAREIQAEITPEEETRLASLEEVNPEAHMAYMRGRVEASKGTTEGYEEAIQYFQEAVEKDSSYAPAYAGLAGSQLLLQMTEPDSAVDLTVAAEAAATAVRLDAESPEAQAVLSGVNSFVVVLSDSMRRQLGALNVRFDSIVLPNEEWATTFTEFGRQAQRIALEREAVTHERSMPENRVRGARYLASQSRFEEAEEVLRQALQLDSSSVAAWETLEHMYAVRGDFAGAAKVYGERVTRTAEPGGVESARRLERAVAQSGAAGYWEWRLDQLADREARGEEISQVDYATALVSLRRHNQAIARLQRAAEQGDPRLYSLAADPVWDPIRGDPRFVELVDRLRRRPPAPPVKPGPG
ncbi:MAG TPA: hypothetical protein VLC48_02525 [Gemmatimonadota bacterium]|nr:hypothetical protein [Gemmatimonadota bacterium]